MSNKFLRLWLQGLSLSKRSEADKMDAITVDIARDELLHVDVNNKD
jgi:hypothetical protein